MLLSRRNFLQLGSSAAALFCIPTPTFAKNSLTNTMFPLLKGRGAKRLRLYNTHTAEQESIEYWKDGAYCMDAMKLLSRLLRDHRSGSVKMIHPKLFDALFKMSQLLGYEKNFDIVSGYRSPETNKKLRNRHKGVAKNSFHTKGMAADVLFKNPMLLSRAHKAAQSLRCGGVGRYSSSRFVHLDVRGKPVHWGA